MKKTQDEIDKEVLKEVFSTKGIIEKGVLQKKICKGNATNKKYFGKIYNALLNVDIVDKDIKLNKDYRKILRFKNKKKNEIILEIIPHIQRFYKDYKKAISGASNSLKQEYSQFDDSENYKIRNDDINKEHKKLYGEHLFSLANQVQEYLYGLVNNKEPKQIKKTHNVLSDPLEDEHNQLVNRLSFKNVVNIILKNDLKDIDDKSILEIIRHWYYQDGDIDISVGIGDERRNYRENDIDRELKKLYKDESEENLIIIEKFHSIHNYILLKVLSYVRRKKISFDYKYLDLLKKFDTIVSNKDLTIDVKLKKFTCEEIDILKVFQLIYMNEETKKDELLTEKKVQDSHVNNIKKDIVTALKLIGIIKKNITPTSYKLKVPKDPIYRLGADTKVETINTLIDKLCEVSDKDISPETKAQILKIFDFTVPKYNLKKRIVLRRNSNLYFKFLTSSFHK